jgi:hypothetical protein
MNAWLCARLIENISDISKSPILLNANKFKLRLSCQMNSKYMVIVAAMAVMLIGAAALATDDAFAGKKKYGKNQATSQANACGNGKLPMNIFCQNIGSQIQGDENAVAASGLQQVQEDRHHGGGENHHGGGDMIEEIQ